MNESLASVFKQVRTMKRFDRREIILTVSALAMACATPDPRRVSGDTSVAEGARRDTLFTRPTAAETVKPASANLVPDLSLPDSLGYSLTAFVGDGRAGELPELGIVDSLGRRTGFDPGSSRSLEEIPEAGYFSDPALDDDSAPDRDSTPPAELPIDSRELHLSAHAGDRYTLEIAASDSGTFAFSVRLHANRGNRSVIRQMHAFSLGPKQVRRFQVRIGAGTMELTELH